MLRKPPFANHPASVSWLFFAFIFLFGAYFRLVNLGTSPGWYSDEGNFIDVAQHWMEGKWENYGITGAPYIQRPPLFMYALSLVFRIGGVDIAVSRGLCVFYSLISMVLLFVIIREREGSSLALLASGVYAIAPWIVAFNRFGLSYNQVMPCFLLVIWSALRIQRGGGVFWLGIGALASAAAVVTDYLAIIVALVFLGVLLAWRRRWILPALGIMFGGAVAAVLPLILRDPGLFFQDTLFTLTHRTQGTSAGSTLVSLIFNYGELLRSTSWILVALAGLFLLKDRGLQAVLLGSVGMTLAVVMRTYTPTGVGLHYLMPVFPFFAAGMAVFIQRGFELASETFNHLFASLLTRLHGDWLKKWGRIGMTILAGCVVVPPMLWMLFASFAMVAVNTQVIFTGNDDVYLVEAEDAASAREFLKNHLGNDDLVLGSPALIWDLPGKSADFMTALHASLTSSDQPSAFIAISPERVVYTSDYKEAEYVIFDRLALEFAPLVLPDMDQLITNVQSNWSQVFQSDGIVIYENLGH